MESGIKKPLSICTTNTERRSRRLSPQAIQILQFIHHFRHVNAHHVQLNLQHTSVTTTHNNLKQLLEKGYLARHYSATDRAVNRPASYYLTSVGRKLLLAEYPEERFRTARSIAADITMSMRSRERYHVLADTYAHFKRHHNGYFLLSTAANLIGVENLPEEIPDGYLRITRRGGSVRHHFIEIYGWGRSTQQQAKRLQSYFDYADYGDWKSVFGQVEPMLLVVASSEAARRRLKSHLRRLRDYTYSDLPICTTTVAKLHGPRSMIWAKL